MSADRVIVFGTGHAAREYASRCPDRIVAYADNQPSRQGGRFLGRPVVAPGEIDRFRPDRIIAVGMYAQEIKAQLLRAGWEPSRIETPPFESIDIKPLPLPWGCLVLALAALAALATWILV